MGTALQHLADSRRTSRQSMFKQSSPDTKFTFSKCVLSCCRSCSFCLFPRATAKERYKSLYTKDKNKRCERCFLCKSMSFCPTCSKCPQCCPKFSCKGQTAEVLGSLAHSGGKSKGGLDFARGIHATLQNQATSVECCPLRTDGSLFSRNYSSSKAGTVVQSDSSCP